jgi:SAM-dependent methyltransferase
MNTKGTKEPKWLFFKKGYDKIWSDLIPKATISSFDPVWEYLRDWIPLKGWILDAGCGDGRYLARFRQVITGNSPVHVVGIDISETPARFYDDVIVADVSATPFPAEMFDSIYCNAVLSCVSDQGKALEEFCRLLKPGGRVFFSFPTQYSLWTLERELRNCAGLGKFCSQNLTYLPADTIRTLLKELGFEVRFYSGYRLFYFPYLILRFLNYFYKKRHGGNLPAIDRCYQRLLRLEKRVPQFLLRKFSYHTIWVAEKVK